MFSHSIQSLLLSCNRYNSILCCWSGTLMQRNYTLQNHTDLAPQQHPCNTPDYPGNRNIRCMWFSEFRYMRNLNSHYIRRYIQTITQQNMPIEPFRSIYPFSVRCKYRRHLRQLQLSATWSCYMLVSTNGWT